MEKRLFQKYFKLPFTIDRFETYVWDDTQNQMVFMFDEQLKDEEIKHDIINAINTAEISETLIDKSFTNPNQDDELFMDGKYIMCIRGWGYLTGVGGHNLSAKDASEIQDDLMDFILNRLNHENSTTK